MQYDFTRGMISLLPLSAELAHLLTAIAPQKHLQKVLSCFYKIKTSDEGDWGKSFPPKRNKINLNFNDIF